MLLLVDYCFPFEASSPSFLPKDTDKALESSSPSFLLEDTDKALEASSPSFLLEDMDKAYISGKLGYFDLGIEHVPLGSHVRNKGKVTYLEVKNNKFAAKYSHRVVGQSGMRFQNIHLGVYDRVEDATIAKTIFLACIENKLIEEKVLRMCSQGSDDDVMDKIMRTITKKEKVELLRNITEGTRKRARTSG